MLLPYAGGISALKLKSFINDNKDEIYKTVQQSYDRLMPELKQRSKHLLPQHDAGGDLWLILLLYSHQIPNSYRIATRLFV